MSCVYMTQKRRHMNRMVLYTTKTVYHDDPTRSCHPKGHTSGMVSYDLTRSCHPKGRASGMVCHMTLLGHVTLKVIQAEWCVI